LNEAERQFQKDRMSAKEIPQFERAVDGDTGEQVLLRKPATNFRLTAHNGEAIVDADQMNALVEQLAESRRMRAAERAEEHAKEARSAVEAVQSKTMKEVDALRAEIAAIKAGAVAAPARAETLESANRNTETGAPQSTENQPLSNQQAMSDNDKYAEFARLMALHEQEKAAAEQAKKAEQDKAAAEDERIQQLVKSQLEKERETVLKSNINNNNNKRKSGGGGDEDSNDEDDDLDFLEDGGDEGDTEQVAKKSKAASEVIGNIKEKFDSLRKKKENLERSKERFALKKHTFDAKTVEMGEKKLQSREARLKNEQAGVFDWTALKFAEFEKETNGATGSDYASLIADLKSRDSVPTSAIDSLQTTVVAAASTAEKFRAQATTLKAKEQELQQLRKAHAEHEIQMERARMGLIAKAEVERADPALRARSIATASTAAAPAAAAAAVSADNASKLEGFQAYRSNGQFIATASSVSTLDEIDRDGAPVNTTAQEFAEESKHLPKWVQKPVDFRDIPNYGPYGSRTAVIHPAQTPTRGMAHSSYPGHQEAYQRLLSERAKLSTTRKKDVYVGEIGNAVVRGFGRDEFATPSSTFVNTQQVPDTFY
jgi:hypothetical protein